MGSACRTALSQLTGEICGARRDAVSCINLLWFMASNSSTDDPQLGLNESLVGAKCRNIFQVLSWKVGAEMGDSY